MAPQFGTGRARRPVVQGRLPAILVISVLTGRGPESLRCEVISVASEVGEAHDKASSLSFDVVVLDVNLNGAYSYPVAELLSEKRIPFIFSTGYGSAGIPEALRHVPIVGKPFHEETLKAALEAR